MGRQQRGGKLRKFFANKMALVAVLVALQAALLVWLVSWLAACSVIVWLLFSLLSVCVVVWLGGRAENPSYKLAWVILILVMPLFGGLFYLLFGTKRTSRRLSEQLRGAERQIAGAGAPVSRLGGLESACPQFFPMARFLERAARAPLYSGTRADYFPLGENLWRSMLAELEKARRFIFLEYFILEDGEMWRPIFDILRRKAAQGVHIRFLYDDLGSVQTLGSCARQLREAGVQVAAFNPLRARLSPMLNYRDHRKLTIIDGSVGFCGGANIADEYINAVELHGHWKDTGVLLRGQAVWSVTAMFLSLWNFTVPTDQDFGQFAPAASCESGGFVQPFGDSPLDRVNVTEQVYMQVLGRASRYVWITTPYLILDGEMSTALCMAARGGVDVRIITPHIPDKWLVHETTRSFYRQLQNAGVRILEYKPGFIHAKMFVADDQVAIVGTANMDYRSFYLHFECGVCFYHHEAVAAVREDIRRTMEACVEIPPDCDSRLPWYRKALRALLRLFSPMM